MHKSKFAILFGTTFAIIASGVYFSSLSKKNNESLEGTEVVSFENLSEPIKCYTEYVPQDTKYSSNQNVHLGHIGNITKVWDKYKGENIRVAVIDTGIDGNHPDFYDEDGNCTIDFENSRFYAHVTSATSDEHTNYSIQQTFESPVGSGNWYWPSGTSLKYFSYSGPGKGYYFDNTFYGGIDLLGHEPVTDSNSPYHGTNVAGTIAAFAHDYSETGCVGVAPKVQILPIKVDMYMDSIASALYYIRELNTDSNPDNDIDVINISISGPSSDSSLVTYANSLVNEHNVIIVAAAGNKNVTTPSYPAAIKSIIGVGALAENSDTTKAGYSNFNDPNATSSTSNNNVDVVAPGTVYVPDYPSSYDKVSGTSFASPIVAAAAALWRQKYPNKTSSEFKSELFNSCIDINNDGWDTTFGYGRLCIDELIGTDDIVDISSLSLPSSSSVGVGENVTLTPTLNPSNTDCDDLLWWSDNTSIATVDHDGVVTGVSNGTTSIHVKSLTKPNDSSCKAACSVTVSTATYGSYYDGITATDAAGLSAQLHNLMFDTHTWYSSYDDCRNTNGEYYAMDPGTSESYLTDFYTQHDIDKTWSGNSSGTWNREHVWCQSKSAGLWNDTSGSTRGGGADYHHIRPIEHDLNSTRNNNTYGEVENKTSSTAKYSKTSSGTNAYLGGYLENGVWEPLPSVKGDIARILMYVWVHYATDAGGTTPSQYSRYVGNLKLNDIICEGTSVSASKAMLLKWHNEDPVDESERIRNQVAYSYQGNRNPFIDHQEYANIIFATDVVHVNSVSLNTDSLTLLPGGTSTLTATVLPVDANNRNVTWSTSDAAVATVSNGNVTAVGPGTATITCSSVDGNKTDTCTVTVNPRAVTKVELNKEELSIPCGSTDSTLSVTVSPDNATYKTVTWSVIEDNPSGCVTVDANGKVKGVAIGTAKVKVTSTSDSTIYDTCNVTVTPVAVTSITITCSKTSLKVGDTSQVNISSIIPSGATNKTVEWISSNDSVLTVDSSGLVTAVGPGTADVTAKAKDGSNVVSNAKSFTVGDILTSIEFSNLPINNTVPYMSGDGNFNLSVTAHYQSGATLDVTSELTSQSIVTVDTTKLGKQHVKAYFKFDGVTKNCETDITVTNVGSASHAETIEGTEITTEIKSKTFFSNGNTVIDGVTFSLNAKTSYFGSTDATKGQAIGKSGDGPDTMSLTQNNQARVTRVAITTSGAVGIKGATLRVKVGSTYFAYNSNPTSAAAAEAGDIIDTATITSTSTEYVFEGDATGNVTAEWTQTSDVAIYIKKFKVNTETTTVSSFSGQEQADAWATYFIDITRGSNGPCLLSNEAQKKSGLRALWNSAKTEYLNMEAAGKNAFCSSQPNFLVEECMKHYRYIVDTYGEEVDLEDFVVDGSGNAPVNISETRRLINEVFNDSAIVIALISVVGIAAIGVFVIYKKRKEN